MMIMMISVKEVKNSRNGLPFSLANPAAIPNTIDINIMPESTVKSLTHKNEKM